MCSSEKRLNDTIIRTQEGRGVVHHDVRKREELHLICWFDTFKSN